MSFSMMHWQKNLQGWNIFRNFILVTEKNTGDNQIKQLKIKIYNRFDNVGWIFPKTVFFLKDRKNEDHY